MRSRTILGAALVALLVGLSTPGRAAVTIYTDKSQWQNDLGGLFLTEDFADSELNAGVSFISSESGHINPAGEYYQDVLASTSQNEPMTIWGFVPPISAYGGNWTLGGPGGSGNSLLVYMGDPPVYVGAIGNGYGGEFWGFTSDAPFGSVKLVGGSGIHQQTYKLDDMVYSSIPEPASLFLLAVGLGGSLIRRRRN